MILKVKDMTGKSHDVEIEGTDTVSCFREKLYDKTGIHGKDQRLCHAGKMLVADDWFAPRLSISPSDNLVFGEGENEIKAFLVNDPGRIVTIRHPKSKKLEEKYFRELFEYFRETMSKATPPILIRLICGDFPVVELGNETRYSRYEHLPFVSMVHGRSLNYYSPRNDIWTLSIESIRHPVIAEYALRSGNVIHMLINLRSSVISHYLNGYDENITRTVSNGNTIHQGLNLEGICRNKDCTKFNQNVVYTHSKTNYRSYIRGLIRCSGESFDLEHDSEKCVCSECRSQFSPLRCYFFDCFYRVSYILIDSQNNRHLGATDWTKCSNDKLCPEETCDIIEFCRKAKENNTDNNMVVKRMQLETRIYHRRKYSEGSYFNRQELEGERVHPEEAWCLLCPQHLEQPLGMRRQSCGHFYHDQCAKRWKRCLRCCMDEVYSRVKRSDETNYEDERIEFLMNMYLPKQENCDFRVKFVESCEFDIVKSFLV